MKKVKDEPIILYRNGPEIDSLKHDLNELLPFAQKVCEAFHKLPFAVEDAGFYDIISNTSVNANTYLIRTLPDTVEIPGVMVNKQKMIESGMYECPGLAEFNSALTNFKAQSGDQFQSYFRHTNGTAEIDPLTWGAFERRHTISADSPEAKELYRKMTNFFTTIESFHSYMLKTYNTPVLMRGLANYGQFCIVDNEKKLVIKPLVFASLIKRARSKQVEAE
jgi:hypothetical protein